MKIQKAHCPPNVVSGNPCLEYIKYIIFPWFSEFRVSRSQNDDKWVYMLTYFTDQLYEIINSKGWLIQEVRFFGFTKLTVAYLYRTMIYIFLQSVTTAFFLQEVSDFRCLIINVSGCNCPVDVKTKSFPRYRFP